MSCNRMLKVSLFEAKMLGALGWIKGLFNAISLFMHISRLLSAWILQEKKLEWGEGLAQKQEAEAKLQELELEKERPFAQTRDDPELDRMLKERIRWGDPLVHLIKRRVQEPILPNLGNIEKKKESGFIIPLDISTCHICIKRRLDAAPNR